MISSRLFSYPAFKKYRKLPHSCDPDMVNDMYAKLVIHVYINILTMFFFTDLKNHSRTHNNFIPNS